MSNPPRALVPTRALSLRRLVRFVVLTVAVTSVTVLVVAGVTWINPVAGGLKGEYFYVPGGTAPARTLSRRLPSTDDLQSAWRVAPDHFTALWSGSLAVLRDGSYSVTLTCSEPCSVYLDGRQLGSVVAATDSPVANASVRLDRGAHALHVRYAHDNQPMRF